MTLQIWKDRVKRRLIDAARRSNRLKTPMDVVLGTLRAYDLLPAEMNALEVFGMHGLWHTADYYPLCRSLEFYEINQAYARFAQRRFPRASVRVDDSIGRIRSHRLERSEYDFIVIDNPFGGFYGDGYLEHFDVLPHVLDYLQNGVLILNFLRQPQKPSAEHLERRRAFYGTALPTVDQAIDTYRTLFAQRSLRVHRAYFIPRTAAIGYLVFVAGTWDVASTPADASTGSR